MKMCDVCSMPMNNASGYALTTKEVTTDPAYWTYMINLHSFDDDTLMMYIQQQAMQNTGWLICESCSNLFTFDRMSAQRYAENHQNPPGSGPADVNLVAAAAAKAWKAGKGSYPAWLQ